MLSQSTTVAAQDTLSRSIENLSSAISRHRPWPSFTTSLSPPDSLSTAVARIQINAKHFRVNYALVIAASAALFLLVSNPFAAIVYTFLLLAWLLGKYFRDGPMVVYGRHVDDRLVLAGLFVGTVLVFWLVGMVNTLMIGVSVGLLISAVHGAFRDTEGLFLDEDDAVSNGLIASGSRAKGSYV